MITFIILIALILIGWYLTTTYDYELLGSLLMAFTAIYLIFHSIFFLTVEYEYGMFVEKRKAFVMTLKASRESGNKYESAAIVKEVAEWNIKLAENKYDNKTVFCNQYIDDRIEDLEPIK